MWYGCSSLQNSIILTHTMQAGCSDTIQTSLKRVSSSDTPSSLSTFQRVMLQHSGQSGRHIPTQELVLAPTQIVCAGLVEWVGDTFALTDYLLGKKRDEGAHGRYRRPNDVRFTQASVALNHPDFGPPPDLRKVSNVYWMQVAWCWRISASFPDSCACMFLISLHICRQILTIPPYCYLSLKVWPRTRFDDNDRALRTTIILSAKLFSGEFDQSKAPRAGELIRIRHPEQLTPWHISGSWISKSIKCYVG